MITKEHPSPAVPNGLLSAAAMLAVAGLTSRVLGLFRDRLFADRFGAGPLLDAYFAAYRIPDLLYSLLVLGALSATLVPLLSRTLAQTDAGRAEAVRLTDSFLTLAVLVLGVLALGLFVAAPAVSVLVAPGFDLERRTTQVLLTRIMLLQPILLAASSVVSSFLVSSRRFAAYALAPVVYNLGLISGVVVFVPRFGVAGLAWGVVLGALLHLVVQVPSAARAGARFRLRIRLSRGVLAGFADLFVPRLVTLLAQQGASLVVSVAGSLVAAGGLSAFALAENLQSVPVGLVGLSIAMAAFPFLASAAARGPRTDFAELLARSVRVVLFLAVPSSVFLLLLRAQIVRVVLGTGNFSWEDTVTTLSILGFLAFAVVPQCLSPLLTRAFFSLGDARVPMVVSLITIGTHILGAFLLVPRRGITGLALASVGAAVLHFILLLGSLHSRLGGLSDGSLFRSVLRTAFATIVAGLVVQGPGTLLTRLGLLTRDAGTISAGALLAGVKGLIASYVDMQTFFGVATQLFGSLLAGAAIFLLVARLLNSAELAAVVEALRRPRKLPSVLSTVGEREGVGEGL